MLEVSVDKAHLTPTSLRLGLVVRYGKDGPVRFAEAELPLDLVPWEALWVAVQKLDDAPTMERDEPLWAD